MKNFALLGGAALATLLLMEVVFRVFYTPRIKRPRLEVYNGVANEWCCGPEGYQANGLWGYTPNSRFRHCYDGDENGYFDSDGCVSYTINAWGYRGSEPSVEKPSDVYRIVILGDSFTFGEGVPDAQCYPRQLELALTGKRALGKRIEVVNLGVAGANTPMERKTYRVFAHKLKPDHVILQWNTNDFPVAAVYRDHQQQIGRRYRELMADADKQRFSHLLRFFWIRTALWRLSSRVKEMTRAELAQGAGSFNGIENLRRDVASDGAMFTLLIFPELIRLSRYPYAPLIDSVNSYCAQRAIPVVDLFPTLSRYRDRELWVHETDHHPNHVAHAVAARVLEEYLDDSVPLVALHAGAPKRGG